MKLTRAISALSSTARLFNIVSETKSSSGSPVRDLDIEVKVQEYRSLTVTDKRPPVFGSVWQEIVVIIILTLGMALPPANQGSMQIAVPQIGESFGISGGNLSWTISAFTLTSGAFVLLMAALADNIGRKRMLLISYIWFSVWCLVSAFVKNHIVFDIMRGLQGLSGAVSPPAAVGIIGATYIPGKRKNKAMAAIAAGAPLGFIVGITCGGICTEFLSWRSILFFSAIEYTFLAGLGWFLVPNDPAMNWRAVREKLTAIDYFGALLATSGLVLLVFGLTESSVTKEGWRSPYVIVLFVVGIIVIGLFVFWESKAKYPLMPLYIWRYPGVALCMIIIACGFMNFLGVVSYYMVLFFQRVRGASAILTTAYLIPQAVSGILVNVLVAYTLHIIPGRIFMVIAMAAFVISALLWALQPIYLTYWAMAFPAICLSVLGADISFNVANMHILSAVPAELQSSASGILNTVKQIAVSIGLAASSTIVKTAADKSPSDGATRLYDSYRAAFWFAVGVSGIGLLGSLFLKVGTQGSKRKDNANDTPQDTENPENAENAENTENAENAENAEKNAGAR
ncbi:major facilitator superfamily-domain-containing protein [Lipomyces doorenjongii]|uniref:major facilitator superfamily-domain-containing protein n=1 Tax=Lipomyces doorenjongii TaxID=383834 RepID=UPI0034CF16A3